MALTAMAHDVVHPLQRGFMNGRQILYNVVEAEDTMLEYAKCHDGRQG